MRIAKITAIVLAAMMAALATSQLTFAKTVRSDFKVDGEPGIELFVREVRDEDAKPGKLPVILIHGARVPGVASFDLPVEGGSLAEDIAQQAHRVFVMDARGYGGSTRPKAMDGPPSGRPLVSSYEVVRDIHAVVRWVQKRTGAQQVALMGWATGGHWAGMYTSLYPEEVSHLVIYNSLYGGTDGHAMLGRGSPSEDPDHPGQFNTKASGPYRLSTAASLMTQWDRSIPMENKNEWRDPLVAQAYQREALASDVTSAKHNPAAFRAPTGAIEDSFYLAIGRQLWDATPITAKVLIMRSEHDFWSRPEDVKMLAAHLVNAREVRVVAILEGATHHVHLDRPERGRDRFLSSVLAFLNDQPLESLSRAAVSSPSR
jgi:pimeloyl-ACP methyl ester carboxylesterase